MLTQHDVDIAADRVRLTAAASQASLLSNIDTARATINRGGHLIRIVGEFCADEAARRVAAAWNELHHVLVSVRLEYYANIRGDISAAFQRCLLDDSAEMAKHIGLTCALCNFNDAARFITLVDQARAVAIAKVDSDILIFVRHLQSAPAATAIGPSFVFNNSNVSSIQTGAGSIANFSVQINEEGSAAVLSALDLITKELSATRQISDADKVSILELVDDSRAELAKGKPNTLKLSGLLGSLIKVVSFISDLSTSTQLLIAASGALGLL